MFVNVFFEGGVAFHDRLRDKRYLASAATIQVHGWIFLGGYDTKRSGLLDGGETV
jgi:hypothetical protein